MDIFKIISSNRDFVTNAMTDGEKGEKWLRDIPDIITKFEKKWSLKVLTPYTLNYNYVAPAEKENGEKVVLKIGKSWDKEFFTEMEALFLIQGNGAVRLREFDKENAVALLERITPGTPLSTTDDDEEATKILVNVMKKFWKPLPKKHPFIPIFDWTEALHTYVKNNTNNPIPLKFAKEAIDLFTYLISTSKTPVLTHGDLHHDNVLLSDKDSWVAIDPKGIAAEPLYDTAALLKNPYKKLKDMGQDQLDALLTKRIRILSQELGADPVRIYKWGLAQKTLSAVWTRDVPEYVTFSLKIINSLRRINVEKLR